MVKKKFKVKGMDCSACAKMIELDLEDAGIKASCSYATETLEIEHQEEVDSKKIKEIVSNSGYTLSD
jgi:copper chaperone CopZ